MENQIIYLKEKPSCTINPNPIEWSRDRSFGNIQLRANINGPICPEKYFKNKLHILFYLREPYIKPDSWNNGDHGGNHQSTDYGKCEYSQIGNPTFENIVKFTYFFVNLLNGNALPESHFDEHESEAIDLFRNHICVLNACWFPHTGGTNAITGRCINWLIKNDTIFKQMNDLFNPTIIIGAGVLKPQWDSKSGKFKMFGLERVGFLTPKEILPVTDDFQLASKDDHTFLLSDGKIYSNTYHPQIFEPYQTAKSIFKLFVLHDREKLNWNNS